MIKNQHIPYIDEVKNRNERIMWIGGKKLKDKCGFDGMISIYAPTLHSDDSKHDTFYKQLEEEFSEIKTKYGETIVILGDFNARIGKYKQEWEDIRGKFISDYYGKCNESGLRLMNFCLDKKLCIANTYFQKKQYGSFYHKSAKKFMTLDYCLVPRDCKQQIKDCEISHTINCWTDHWAIKCIFKSIKKLKTKKNKEHI